MISELQVSLAPMSCNTNLFPPVNQMALQWGSGESRPSHLELQARSVISQGCCRGLRVIRSCCLASGSLTLCSGVCRSSSGTCSTSSGRLWNRELWRSDEACRPQYSCRTLSSSAPPSSGNQGPNNYTCTTGMLGIFHLPVSLWMFSI